MTVMMRRAIAALLTAHAVAHLTGFAWPWWVLEPLPTPPNNAAVIGDAAMRATSLLWLGVALAFGLAALELLYNGRHWRQVTAAAAATSFALSVACLPGSLLGVPINLAILLVLFGTRGRTAVAIR